MRVMKIIGLAMTLATMVLPTTAITTYAANEKASSATITAPGQTGSSQDVTSEQLGEYLATSSGKQYLTKLRTDEDGKNYSSSTKYGKLTVGNTTYYITKSEYDTLVNKANSYASNVNADGGLSDINDDLDTLTNNFNTRPDLATAGQAVSGLEGMISVVVGIALIIACIMVAFFSAMDIIYLAWPVFREKAETSSKSEGMSISRFISDEAKFAVKKASTDANGRSVWGIYLPKRMVAYIGLGLALYILFTGNITVIVSLALKFASGIFNALKMLG